MYDVGGIMTLRHMKIFVAVLKTAVSQRRQRNCILRSLPSVFLSKSWRTIMGNDFLSGSADESIRPQQPETFMVMQSILYLYLRQWKRN